MANLTNNYIYETFPSLVGIGDQGSSGVTGTLKPLTDGVGVHMPIEVSLTAVDITAATTTTKNLSIDGYGQVIDNNGNWVGAGSATTSGTSGSSGTNGTSGTNGVAGTSGTDGSSGSSGVNGVAGTSGTDGSSGSSGVNGVAGTSGTDGSSGSSGVNGVAGTSGTDGSSGSSGTDGTSGVSPAGAITSGGPNTITEVWSGSQAQYDALGSYSATTLYFID